MYISAHRCGESKFVHFFGDSNFRVAIHYTADPVGSASYGLELCIFVGARGGVHKKIENQWKWRAAKNKRETHYKLTHFSDVTNQM